MQEFLVKFFVIRKLFLFTLHQAWEGVLGREEGEKRRCVYVGGWGGGYEQSIRDVTSGAPS